MGVHRAVGLLEDVADAFVGRSQGGGFGQGGKDAHCCQPLGNVTQAAGAQREHGIHFLGAVALLAQGAGQPVEQKVGQGLQRGAAVSRQFVTKGGVRRVEQTCQRQRGRLFGQHTQHTQRMAAQGKWVLVTRGQVADAEHADQRLQLVSQRHHNTYRVAWQGVAGKTRLVVGFDGIGHRQVQSVVERVVAAHGALQLGELTHHIGHQVGLGQLGGLVGLGHQRRIAQLRSDGLRNGAHALDPFALGTELVVVDHLAQAIHA